MNALADALASAVHFWDHTYCRGRSLLARLLNEVYYLCYQLGGSVGTGRGYAVRREKEVLRALSNPSFSLDRLPSAFGKGLDERVIEYPWALSRLPAGRGKLLDAGSVLNWDFLLRRSPLKEKQVFISTLAPETQSFWWRGVSYVYEDLRQTCFRPETFDWIVCLSTIEHVGLNNAVYTSDPSKRESAPGDYLVFLQRLHELLRPGGKLLLSFPFGRAAQHGWLQVFDLAAVEQMVAAFQPSLHTESYFRHRQQGWISCSPEQASDAFYFGRGANATQNPLKLPAAEAVACLEMIK